MDIRLNNRSAKWYLCFITLLVILFVLVLVGCSEETSATSFVTSAEVVGTTTEQRITTKIEETTIKPDITTPNITTTVASPSFPKRADGVSKEIVLSPNTLSAATTENATLIDTYEEYLQAGFLSDVTYTEEFFQKKQLVFLQYEHGGAAIYRTVSELFVEDRVMTLTVEIEAASEQTTAIHHMLVLLEVEKREDWGNVESVAVKYNTVYFDNNPLPKRADGVSKEIVLSPNTLSAATTENATLIDTYEEYLQAGFLSDVTYTEEFFQKKQLVFLQYEHGGAAIYRTVSELFVEDHVMTLTVEIEAASEQTTAIHYMLVLLEVEKREDWGYIESVKTVFNRFDQADVMRNSDH